MKLTVFRVGGAILVAFALFTASVKTNNHKFLRSSDALDEKGAFHFYSDPTNKLSGAAGDTDDEDWSPLVGFWVGGINDDLRILFRITPQYGEVFAYSLDQFGAIIPATGTRFDKDKKEFRLFFSTIDGVYTASLDEDGDQMTGTWNQGTKLSMEMQRFASTNEASVPREFRFLVEKSVTADAGDLMEMVGFWTGYSNLNVETPDEPELVVVQIEKVGDLVEPKMFLPDESPLPFGIRNFVVSSTKEVKIVLDDPEGGNAIFHGQLDGKNLTGTVTYDDTDYAPPLTLVWSETRTDTLVEESKE